MSCRAVGPDDGEELAVIDMEGNPIDRLDSLERQVHVRHLQEVVVPLRPGSLRPTLEQLPAHLWGHIAFERQPRPTGVCLAEKRRASF